MGNHSRLIIKEINRSYKSENAIENVLRYIVRNKENNQTVRYWRAFGASSKNIEKVIRQYIQIQEIAGKTDKKRIRHIVISFPAYMDDANVAKLVAERVAGVIYENYQVTYGVHEKEGNLHVHFGINPVSYNTHKKWHMSKIEFQEWKKDICIAVNLCLTENGYKKCDI